MPLSDHEKRMLQEMEAALLTEDPRLVSALSGNGRPVHRRTQLVGLGLIVFGIATLFAGLIAKVTPLGLVGFLIALVGVITLLSTLGARSQRDRGAGRAGGMNIRLQRRWDERNNQ
ncbi:MAG: DUF3040 domain-containing protein [Actinomycetota bacterium]|nr:DUF3040 domain-containing protein [Actinomycetota bacterium]